MAAELDRVCPISKDENGKDVSSCPAIDKYFARLEKFSRQLQVTE